MTSQYLFLLFIISFSAAGVKSWRKRVLVLMKESYGRLYVGKTSILKIGQPCSDSVYFYYVIKAPFSTVTYCIISVPCLSIWYCPVICLLCFSFFLLFSYYPLLIVSQQKEYSEKEAISVCQLKWDKSLIWLLYGEVLFIYILQTWLSQFSHTAIIRSYAFNMRFVHRVSKSWAKIHNPRF